MSPIRPGPTRPGVPDTAPLANATFDVVNDGGLVASFTTDAEGKFRVAVAPGHYSVKQRTTKKIGGCRMLTADVPASGFVTVAWVCDTGMR